MKPPEGFSEKVRARITEITGTDPGPFHIGSYTPGTNPDTTEAQLVEAMAQSMARLKPEDRSSQPKHNEREPVNVRDFVSKLT